MYSIQAQLKAMKRICILFFATLLIPLLGTGQNLFTLSGIISDSLSGETLKNIDIVIEKVKTGTISNEKGAYILYLDKGKYNVTYSAPGYQKQQICVELSRNEVRLIELIPKIAIDKKTMQYKLRFALKDLKKQDLLSDIIQQ